MSEKRSRRAQRSVAERFRSHAHGCGYQWSRVRNECATPRGVDQKCDAQSMVTVSVLKGLPTAVPVAGCILMMMVTASLGVKLLVLCIRRIKSQRTGAGDALPEEADQQHEAKARLHRRIIASRLVRIDRRPGALIGATRTWLRSVTVLLDPGRASMPYNCLDRPPSV